VILVYKFVQTESHISNAPEPERPFVPKLIGEYQDEEMAKKVIGEGQFAIYESVGKPDENGLYKSFKLVAPVKENTRDVGSYSFRKKQKVSL
jgi:hypothetical protein